MRSTLLQLAIWIACWMAGRIDAQQSSPAGLDHLIAHAPKSPSLAAWTFDPSDFRQDLRQLPIGVFDSGIGGLTVLEAILGLDAYNNDTLQPGADGRKDFEGESFV